MKFDKLELQTLRVQFYIREFDKAQNELKELRLELELAKRQIETLYNEKYQI